MRGNRIGRSERGAVLIQVALCLLALCGFGALAVDWGLFWVSRAQAQASADAGALAGAVALTFDDFNNRTDAGVAKRSALNAARTNHVFGQTPSVNISSDVTFPSCPDGGGNACVRVDVYRTQARGNALPVFLGPFIGVTAQDVRATATAQSRAGNATNCLKPFAIPDRWEEHYPAPPLPYNPSTSSFDTADKKGPLADPDRYRPPSQSDLTGFRATGTPNDIGAAVNLKASHSGGISEGGWLYAVRLKPDDSGGADMVRNLEQCVGDIIKIGDTLHQETGQMTGPIGTGVQFLIDADSGASWYDPDGPGGTPGKVINSCMQSASCPSPASVSPTQSPRVVAIALFDPSKFVEGGDIKIVNILAFFIDKWDSAKKVVSGYLTSYPALLSTGGDPVVDQAAFGRTVVLVR